MDADFLMLQIVLEVCSLCCLLDRMDEGDDEDIPVDTSLNETEPQRS